ncbi:efflux RND transporter periplasmic adaptor subunit [Polluticoccus soli]|uniref:efflux RND transporter periplasmic adaptor subunit n=1 Tax=Polluticoccus soli TaxID=3034150 RepID=UPI0023E2AA45|nr:efflux RND transporter periplasmic adaptor subunit [Flavipsychrobacter sp. JY13-12]
MKKRTLIVVIVAMFAVIGIVLANNKKELDAKKVVVDRSKIPVSVAVAKVTMQTLDGNLRLPATLEPAKTADISATTGGKIVSLRIQLGSHVSMGQVIGSVDTRQQQLGENDAQEALRKAEKDYQLSKELYEGNAGTAQGVKDAQHALDAARIRVQQSGQKVGDGAIKSPISGIITTKNGEVGEYANPGATLATVVDVYSLKAVVFVSEKDVYQLKIGRPAAIAADVLPGKTFNGKVSFISPVGDENHNYRVELTVDNKAAELKAGTYTQVNFDLGSSTNALQMPKIALVEGTKNPYVYVVNGEQVIMKKITVGREVGENIEVLNGLNEGEEIVTSGQINLTNGSRITRTR